MNNFLLYAIISVFIFGCSEYDSGEPVVPEIESPVVMDLSRVPYPTLSEYNFFDNPLKEQQPVEGVIPYEPINTLFTDYAHKKRFIWMPEGTKANYVSDDEPFDFPEGAAVIKTFYYDNVQPQNLSRIIETRLMIRKNGQWIFANYVWNEEQTEAFLDLEGSELYITFNESGETKTSRYRIPSESECLTCHKIEENAVLIGPKPRNLNSPYSFDDGIMNQIQKWKEYGYLNASSLPAQFGTVPSWTNAALPKEDRVRAYMDMNCAHCHKELAHCSYRPVRFSWEETVLESNMGLCEPQTEPIPGYEYIIQPGNDQRSSLYYRITTDEISYRMPFLGRSIVHEEAATLFREWINEMAHENCE